jgi:hypothetical protein
MPRTKWSISAAFALFGLLPVVTILGMSPERVLAETSMRVVSSSQDAIPSTSSRHLPFDSVIPSSETIRRHMQLPQRIAKKRAAFPLGTAVTLAKDI